MYETASHIRSSDDWKTSIRDLSFQRLHFEKSERNEEAGYQFRTDSSTTPLQLSQIRTQNTSGGDSGDLDTRTILPVQANIHPLLD